MTRSLTSLCRYIVLLACLTISFGAFAQQEYRAKVYQHTSWRRSVYQREGVNNSRDVSTGTFSVAFNVISLKGNFHHELEIFVPEINRPANHIQFATDYNLSHAKATKDVVSAYSFRYEINQDITNVTKRFVLNLGAGINPYYVEIDRKPADPSYYSVHVKYTGATINLIPRVSCNLSERLSVELSMPLHIVDFRKESQRIDSPLLPGSTNSTKRKFFDDIYTVRFGLAYVLF